VSRHAWSGRTRAETSSGWHDALQGALSAADAISVLGASGEKAWELGLIRPSAEGVPASAQIVAGSVP